jgi:hypothetical protein
MARKKLDFLPKALQATPLFDLPRQVRTLSGQRPVDGLMDGLVCDHDSSEERIHQVVEFDRAAEMFENCRESGRQISTLFTGHQRSDSSNKVEIRTAMFRIRDRESQKWNREAMKKPATANLNWFEICYNSIS